MNASPTKHRIIHGDSTDLSAISDNSIDLVITSPPYPMIEMWDDVFSSQDPRISQAIMDENGGLAFELMHEILDRTWSEVFRTLKEGGMACINIGDATRKVGNEFRMYPNYPRIVTECLRNGFTILPGILWRKQTNSPNKFMGSGMLPAGAYVTLEHEHILILRKGGVRPFRTVEEKSSRRESAFFWEERNLWFSDLWNMKGEKQATNGHEARGRSGAFPFELAYRLISMFSVRGDSILDPFLGTGTTTIAAMASGRNSVGYEIDRAMMKMAYSRIENVVEYSNRRIGERLGKHEEFVRDRMANGRLNYMNERHSFPVMTSQEVMISINRLKGLRQVQEDTFEVQYEDVEESDHFQRR
ncbi:MAG: site-specific DNA-methyltransferase [Candidatus Thermoplasmatota archaeon]|nr:site-specific DNA-methyltransferase [Candidatus Thermoplasmatota archaeon]